MERMQKLQLDLTSCQIADNLFSHVTMAPPDPILGTAIAFNNDKSGDKINLGIGAYRDQNGKPYTFKIVKKVEEQILKTANHEYLPIDGLPEFCTGSRNLLFGTDSPAIKQQRIASCQAISGTGALSLGFTFLNDYLPRLVYISDPTWLNHKNIIEHAGLKWVEYPYFDPKTKGFNFEAMINFLSNAVSGSIVLLHACAHNPTGVDPTQQQWKKICTVMKKNSLIPFFDSAYQGFATGDLQLDAWPIRYFISEGFQMIVAQSFAKNIGLYGQRIGALHVVASNKETNDKVLSQIKIIARKMYSNPPMHGALIVGKVLNNKQYFAQWQKQLQFDVANRIIKMRKLLRQELQRIKTPGTWNHITDQIGMFSFTGLTTKQCQILIDKFHIYLLKSGRISMAGINDKNYKYLASSIKSAIEQASK